MSSRKEIDKFLRLLHDSGFEVTNTKNGHQVIKYRGKPLTTVPGSPSDRRWKNNAIADINRSMRELVKDNP